MKIKIISEILVIMIVSLVTCLNAEANICERRDDVVRSTQQFGAFLQEAVTGLVRVGGKKLNDGEAVKVDSAELEKISAASLADEGFLTNVSNVSFKDILGGKVATGGIVHLSPCHAITNLHVIKGLVDQRECVNAAGGVRALYDECMAGKEQREYQNKGERLTGVFQKSCDGTEIRNEYQVVEVPKSTSKDKVYYMNNGKLKIRTFFDYGVLKMTKGEPVRYAKNLQNSLFEQNDIAFPVGVAIEKIDKDGVRFQRVLIDRIAGPGHLRFSGDEPGKSGRGVYKISNKSGKFELGGLYVGSSAFVEVIDILTYLDNINPRLVAEIEKANKTGRCE